MCAASYVADGAQDITAWSSGFANTAEQNSDVTANNQVVAGTANLQSAVASVDPGVYTIPPGEGWITNTIAIRPAAAVPAAAITGTVVTGGVLESEIVAGGETVIITLTDDTFVSNTIVTPVIEAADCTVSGSNTAQATWAVSHPNASAGDLLTFNIAWDDSTETTDVTEPAGPNSEVLSEVNATPAASFGTEVRCKAWYTIATG